MKQERQNIKWASNCVDPGSRVFFIGNRVFRAFDSFRAQEALDFLHSELYAKLLKDGMIVRTWEANDVQLPDYPVILEHEFLTCTPAQWLSLEQLKDILVFHFEIDAICKPYGYGIRDIGFDNVVLCKGKLCFIDFGSFRKIENIDDAVLLGYCLPLAYLPIALYSKDAGYDYIADRMIVDYDMWFTEKCLPSNEISFWRLMRPYLSPIIKRYECHLARYHSMRWNTSRYYTTRIYDMLNSIARRILRKPYGWDMIKIQNEYTREKVIEAVKNLPNPYVAIPVDVVDDEQFGELYKFVERHIPSTISKVVLWGNFTAKQIETFLKNRPWKVTVLTCDRVYASKLYRECLGLHLDVRFLCANILRGKDYIMLRQLKTDVIILQNDIYQQTRIGTHLDWTEKAAEIADYIVMRVMPEEDIVDARMCDYWVKMIEQFQYQIYSKMGILQEMSCGLERANTPPGKQ